jgi:hypothetical protein
MFCCAGIFLTLAPLALVGQTVTGSVRDLAEGNPVFGVTVSLIKGDTTSVKLAMTDSLGFYRIAAPGAGPYKLHLSRIGFAPTQTATLMLVQDSTINRDVFLKQISQTLAPVDISEKPIVTATAANPHKFDLFLQRRARGFGFFLTHDQIKTKINFKLQQLLQSIPGIKVRQIGTTFVLQSQHCPGKGIPGAGNDPARKPIIFVDGHLTAGQEQLDLINSSQIEGLEVYQGASEMPSEAIGQACFAIFIWLRTIGP